jgi:O-antigen/teichoic acid export membrane protein
MPTIKGTSLGSFVQQKYARFKGVSLFALSSVILNFSGIISGFLLYKWVDPYYVGLWSNLLLIDTYSTFLRLGIINGMNRQFPYWLGKGNVERANKIVETAYAYTLRIVMFFLACSIGYIFIIGVKKDLLFSAIIIVSYVVINMYNAFLLGTFRSNTDFGRLKNIQYFQSFLKLIAIIPVIYFGYNGYITGLLFTLFISTCIAHHYRPYKVKPKFYKEEFTELLKIGLPIFVGSYLLIVINTIPRVILLKYGTVEMMGFYSPLSSIILIVTVLPDSITAYLYPKMVYDLSKSNNKSIVLWRKTLLSQFGLVAIGVPLVIMGYFFLPYFISRHLPKYIGSINILKFGIFTSLFMSYKFVYTTFIVLKKWNYMVFYLVIFTILQFICPIVMMRFTGVLNGVVWGQLISAFLMCIFSLALSYIVTHQQSDEEVN